MRLFKILSKVAAAILAVCGLVMTSCEGPEKAGGALTISLQTVSVGPEKGTQFVSVKCADSWTLRLVADGSEVTWASLNITSGVGNKNGVILSYDANTTDAKRSLDVVLDNGARQVLCKMTQAAPVVQPTPDPTPDPEPGPNPTPDENPLGKTGWLELPALDDPALGYYSHSFKMNGKTYRNYSFGWSQKDLVSVWVAYPLCKMYTVKGVDRNEADDWALDPHLGNNSSAPFGGYGDDYDRGHQLPFADRSCCLEAAKQTFYGSNMTPQDPSLNQNTWAAFEDKVRTWANSSDTLYVVTGCVVEPPLGYTVDSYKKTMTVPSAYFKALLKYNKSSTLGQWNAAGFYYEHKSNATQQVMSIDKLEEMTGIDFFVNLESKVGAEQAARLEAMTPNTSVWQ